MIKLFCGFDRREEPGLHVFVSSVLRNASRPIEFAPLDCNGMKTGSNEFTLSRFLVPYLCGFKGRAIFCDGSDMVMQGDIAELDSLFDPRYAVQVVQHPSYISKHRMKYVGTPLECQQSNYARKNWASVMLINCEHPGWREIRKYLVESTMLKMLQFSFLADEAIGELPTDWNVLVDEGQDSETAKIMHWTAGIPFFPHYATANRAAVWFAARDLAWLAKET